MLDLIEASADPESHIPNSIIPVASSSFEEIDNSTYDLSNSTPAPTRINGMTSRVNGTSVLPSTSNESIYCSLCISYLYCFTFVHDYTQLNQSKSEHLQIEFRFIEQIEVFQNKILHANRKHCLNCVLS